MSKMPLTVDQFGLKFIKARYSCLKLKYKVYITIGYYYIQFKLLQAFGQVKRQTEVYTDEQIDG